jgi:cysteine desulfurase/selenocysteine lyase
MNTGFLEKYRAEFPVTEKYVYLDHSGVAPLSRRVKQAIESFLAESTLGGAFHYAKWMQQVLDARRACARLVNSGPEEIAFVKSTSHGLSIVAAGLDWQSGDNVLIYEKEFPSNLYPWHNLRRRGVEIRVIPSRDGGILPEDVDRLIDRRTRLLAISSVQFVNGFRIDLKKIGGLCRQRNVLFCVDAIQSLGVIPMDVKKYDIDFLAADAHKWLLGPEGIGLFFCRRELAERINPPLIGWKSVRNDLSFERPEFELKTDALRFEEGSMNLLGILGLDAAVRLLLEVGIEKVQEQVQGLGDFIIQEAETRGFTVLTPRSRDERGGNITFKGKFDPMKVRDVLLKKGVMVNCRGGGLRVSPHFYNTTGDIDHFFAMLAAAL